MSITSLTDLEVLEQLNQAKDAYEDALLEHADADTRSVYAADVLVLSQEVLRRGLVLGTVH